jgi:hypothetical protein
VRLKQKQIILIVIVIAVGILGVVGYTQFYPSYRRQSILLKQEDVEPKFRQMLAGLTPDADKAVFSYQDPKWEYVKYEPYADWFGSNTHYEWTVIQGYIKADFSSTDLAKINLAAISDYYTLDNEYNFTARQAILNKRAKAYPGETLLDEAGASFSTKPYLYHFNYNVKVTDDNFESGQFSIEINYSCKASCDDWK